MSIHAERIDCEYVGDVQIWRARCGCGWSGDQHPAQDSQAHDFAAREYLEHVEKALGANAYYTAPVACKNCGSVHEQGVLVGRQVTSERCVRCGTTMLAPNNDAWNESSRDADRRAE